VEIKIHSAICANSLKQKVHNQYIIWTLATAISNGEGKCLVPCLLKNYKSIFSVCTKTAYNHLNKGTGLFWEIKSGICYLKSLKVIASNCESLFAKSSAFMLSVDDIKNYGMNAKSICISSVVGADTYNKPLSLYYVSRQLNCSKITVRRHIDSNLIFVSPNYLDRGKYKERYWNSYKFVGGRRLPIGKEKPYIKSLSRNKTSNWNLKSKNKSEDFWEIITQK